MEDLIDKLIDDELSRARKKFKPFNSPHESYGVIKEEVEELGQDYENMLSSFDLFWEYVKHDHMGLQQNVVNDMLIITKHLLNEGIQVAAMLKRYKEDLGKGCGNN